MSATPDRTSLNETAEFVSRHVGVSGADIRHMLDVLELSSLDELIGRVVPESIVDQRPLDLPAAVSEEQAMAELKALADKNKLNKSLIGQGYYGCYMPAVLQRNVFENPAWYTAYTPYQPEIAQGRLEVLFNFQTMITELTGMAIANASLLDEATAAAEAMAMAHRALRGKKDRFLVADNCHPQTLDVLNTRAAPLGIAVVSTALSELESAVSADDNCCGVFLQYPGSDGSLIDCSSIAAAARERGSLVVFATDLLALTLLTPPAALGADIVVGSAQRLGVPMGFGGPHAAFMATTDKHKRSLPGRLVGESIDSHGKSAYRLALQTREQHIRREKATSNICTAQALLAILATLYACYHGPSGLKKIALRTHNIARRCALNLKAQGMDVQHKHFFDTVTVKVTDADALVATAAVAGYNLRKYSTNQVSIAFDETSTDDDADSVVHLMAGSRGQGELTDELAIPASLRRTGHYLTQACFNSCHSETEMMRYLRRLAAKDIALDRAMIPLGSCTMKLNAAAEMMPVSWPQLSNMHPFAPAEQSQGYRAMIIELEAMLCACTGYAAVSLQPNAGSQGEYAGLLAITRYHESRGESMRKICLIPSSAHGTNPASAQMAGLEVVVVACDDTGNVDIDDLQTKLDEYGRTVAAIMITYPSTHGVFETGVRDVCERVHAVGAQVYIDGANLNAMVGVAQPGEFGGDVSHLNLHKTFCIPHGGGGPGVGPIGVAAHLAPFLPGHRETGDVEGVVSAAPWGSALILPITWMYIRLMGAEGLHHATRVAILNANYIARRLSAVYPILYEGEQGFVAHECILDTRELKNSVGITVDDLAKRLMDYGFHAPTMSFPVPGTLMIEPTESESLAEIDRFCNAMLSIHQEVMDIQAGIYSSTDNPLVNAPHTAESLLIADWPHQYSRKTAAYPDGESQVGDKYWPPVGRIDNVYGDKNLICSCPPLESYQQPSPSIETEV